MSKEVIEAIVSGYEDTPKALVTIVKRIGSAPRGVGTKMLVLADGRIIGTIGGGCVEAEIRQKALEVIDTKKPTTATVVLTADQAEEEGMVCGGKIERSKERRVGKEVIFK